MLQVKSKIVLISKIVYEKRDGIHGVKYCIRDDDVGWTPVVGKRNALSALASSDNFSK